MACTLVVTCSIFVCHYNHIIKCRLKRCFLSSVSELEGDRRPSIHVQGLLDRGSARKPARPAQAEPSPDDSSSEDDGRGRLFPNLTDRGRASAAASVASAPTAIVKKSPQKGFQPRAMSVASTADISTSFIEVGIVAVSCFIVAWWGLLKFLRFSWYV